MIDLEPMEEIIKLGISTGYIKDIRPLSVLVIAKKESAKTEMVAQFANNPGVLYLNNFTPTSFMDEHIREFGSGLHHHLIIPDLLSCISRQKYLVDTTITFLNAFTEEGVKEIDSKAFEGGKIVLPSAIRGGLITTIAQEDFENRWKRWSSVGFLTRFLPVSYKYGQDVVDRIVDACAQSEQKVLGKPIKLRRSDLVKSIPMPKALGQQLKNPGVKMQRRLRTYGFRGVRHLVRLAMASAYVEKREQVSQYDIDKVLDLVKYCNLEYITIGNKPAPVFPTEIDLELEGGKQ